MKCAKHPRYLAKRQPTSNCIPCWSIWNATRPIRIRPFQPMALLKFAKGKVKECADCHTYHGDFRPDDIFVNLGQIAQKPEYLTVARVRDGKVFVYLHEKDFVEMTEREVKKEDILWDEDE